MNNVEYLREVGFKQIAAKTHIEIEYLEWIVNKDFEKLSKKNVSAFAKILSREYNVDFEKWLLEFNEFIAQSADSKKDLSCVSPKILSYKPKETKSVAWRIIVLLIVIFLAWFFDTFKYLDFIPKMLNDNARNVKYTNSVVVEKAKDNLNKNSANSEILIDKNDSEIEKNESKNNILVEISSADESANKSASKNTSDFVNQNAKDDNLMQNSAEIATPQNLILEPDKNDDVFGLNSKENSIIIKPKVELWLGFVDLDTGNKKTIIIKNDFQIDTSKDQLILTGHGNFSIQNGENEISSGHNKATRCRYIVRNGEIQSINRSEFVRLNKGQEW